MSVSVNVGPVEPASPRLPERLTECHRLIRRQQNEIAHLRAALAVAEAELARLDRSRPAGAGSQVEDPEVVVGRAQLRRVWQQVASSSASTTPGEARATGSRSGHGLRSALRRYGGWLLGGLGRADQHP
jgi:hypothetical protein